MKPMMALYKKEGSSRTRERGNGALCKEEKKSTDEEEWRRMPFEWLKLIVFITKLNSIKKNKLKENFIGKNSQPQLSI